MILLSKNFELLQIRGITQKNRGYQIGNLYRLCRVRGNWLVLMHHKGTEHFTRSNILLIGNARILGTTMIAFITVVPCGEFQLLQFSCIHDFVVACIPDSELLLSELIQFPNLLCDFLYASLISHFIILLILL